MIRDDYTARALNEQRSITDKLDQLLAKVKRLKERLNRVSLLVERFRQAVLSAATSGQLTAAWREEENILRPWEKVSLPQVSSSRLGKMLDQAKNEGELTPYLRNANVQWFNFDLADVQTMRVTENEIETYSVRRGDVFICEGDGSIIL